MDEADIAQQRIEHEERLRQKEWASRRASVSEDCEECGDRIPAARQQATGGTNLCIDCAEVAQAKQQRYS